MSLFVIVPAYQAQSTLRETILRIPPGDWDHIQKLVVVEDGSRDRTGEVADALAGEFPKIEVLRNGHNRGYGPTVKRGLEEARKSGCEVAAVLHADGQYPPERLVEFAGHCIGRNLSLLQGSRHRAGGARQGGMPLYKIVAGKFLVALENWTFGLSLSDYHSGYLFHHRTALDRIPYGALGDSFDFDLQVIACARSLGLAVGEEAIATRYAGEESHLNPITYGLRVLKVLWRYRRGHFKRLCEGRKASTP
ncbi:MAG: glycosyltransferase family 2 protein [Fibrobacterota bacterium]|nr:glycosyltransferase family 2 protein [Fibrobacterota bacterium]QQS06151.1 MAG: glycosyltransferase family 2 protein [Fibrobacterota bacterium]